MHRAGALLSLVLLLTGCAVPRPVTRVSLHRTGPAPEVPDAGAADAAPIRIAAASILSPQETLRSYGAFLAYLEKKVGRPIELVQRRTYQETYDLLKYGSIDLAMVCTYVYVLGHDEIGLEVLAAPEVGGKPEYQSFVITRGDSGITRFEQLAGKRFAFTDPLSTTGRIYPLTLLKAQGRDPGTFFQSTTYTYSHDNSIAAVVRGVVDAAAVDSLVYEQWLRGHPDAVDRLRVIDRSPVLPSPPIVASPRLDPELKNTVRTVLLEMHRDPEGRAVLASLGVDRFVTLPDAAYDPVRKLAEAAGVAP